MNAFDFARTSRTHAEVLAFLKNPELPSRVLKLIEQRFSCSIPTYGVIAGQAVASAIDELLGLTQNLQYSDVDWFVLKDNLFRQSWTSGLPFDEFKKLFAYQHYLKHLRTAYPHLTNAQFQLISQDEQVFQQWKGYNNFIRFFSRLPTQMTGSLFLDENLNQQSYPLALTTGADISGLYRICGIHQEGPIQQIQYVKSTNYNLPLIKQGLDCYTVLAGFDINAIQVGIDLSHNTLCYGNDYIDFLTNRQLQVMQTATPLNSYLRAERKAATGTCFFNRDLHLNTLKYTLLAREGEYLPCVLPLDNELVKVRTPGSLYDLSKYDYLKGIYFHKKDVDYLASDLPFFVNKGNKTLLKIRPVAVQIAEWRENISLVTHTKKLINVPEEVLDNLEQHIDLINVKNAQYVIPVVKNSNELCNNCPPIYSVTQYPGSLKAESAMCITSAESSAQDYLPTCTVHDMPTKIASRDLQLWAITHRSLSMPLLKKSQQQRVIKLKQHLFKNPNVFTVFASTGHALQKLTSPNGSNAKSAAEVVDNLEVYFPKNRYQDFQAYEYIGHVGHATRHGLCEHIFGMSHDKFRLKMLQLQNDNHEAAAKLRKDLFQFQRALIFYFKELSAKYIDICKKLGMRRVTTPNVAAYYAAIEQYCYEGTWNIHQETQDCIFNNFDTSRISFDMAEFQGATLATFNYNEEWKHAQATMPQHPQTLAKLLKVLLGIAFSVDIKRALHRTGPLKTTYINFDQENAKKLIAQATAKFNNTTLHVKELIYATELADEGHEMNHCVGGYVSAVADKRSYIIQYVMTDVNGTSPRPEVHRATAEWRVGHDSKQFVTVQIRKSHNQTPHPKLLELNQLLQEHSLQFVQNVPLDWFNTPSLDQLEI